MNYAQAKKHNDALDSKIAELRSQYLQRYTVKVVERQGARRTVIEEETTDFITEAGRKEVYKQYRSTYPDAKSIFILVEPKEEVKRSVMMKMPVRTDEDREPSLPDPAGVSPIDEEI